MYTQGSKNKPCLLTSGGDRRYGTASQTFANPYVVDSFPSPNTSAKRTGARVPNEPAAKAITAQSAARRGYDVSNGATQYARPHVKMENCKTTVIR